MIPSAPVVLTKVRGLLGLYISYLGQGQDLP